MTKSNPSVVENKISSTLKYLSILERYQGYTRSELETNIDIRGAVERYLYLAVQASIDLAEAVIAFKKLRKPTTFGESFQILAEANMINPALCERLVAMAGFRNVIAHDYEKMNYDILFSVLHERLADIKEFLESAKAIL